MIIDMLEYYNMMRRHNIDIIYSGPLWSDGIEVLVGTLKKRMAFDELPLSASQAVFSVFVEQMNNMLMYSAEKQTYNVLGDKPKEAPRGVFILGVNQKDYFIQSGNAIKNEDIENIKARIDHLNVLDKQELRQYYRSQMKADNSSPNSKGAGIGLIEIARRASSPIEYSFVPFGDGLSFFTMFITIGQGGS